MRQHGVERLLLEALDRKSKIILRSGASFYEGQVERIYENQVIRFSTTSGRNSRTCYLLFADIDEVLTTDI